MQEPLFRHYGVDQSQFWAESNGLEKVYRDRGAQNVSKDSLYLNHILSYVRADRFRGLSNATLLELGSEIEFYEGLPEFLRILKEIVAHESEFARYEVNVEHYVVSTGLRQMIMGSAIAAYVDGVWGCEFVEGPVEPGYLNAPQKELFGGGVITDIAYAIDNTTKTRALFEINKGTNKHTEIDVNATLAPEDRRVPFANMIYVADGPSDVPAFSIVNHFGGRTFAVYAPKDRKQFEQVNRLQRENRVQGIGEASYVEGSLTALWLSDAVTGIAARIVESRKAALRDRVGTTPQHIISKPPNQAADPASAEGIAQIEGKKLPAAEKPITLRPTSMEGKS